MKAVKMAGRVLLIVLVVLILLLLILHFGVTALYLHYFSNSQGEFVIPGLTTAFVPQGFSYLEGEETYLIAGYMSDGTASRVYVRDAEGDTGCTELLFEDGSAYDGHAGGICTNGKYAYLAGGDGVDVFLLADILAGGQAIRLGEITTGFDMAYCSFYNGYLLAGNFYHPETYETPDSHRVTTPAGDENPALICVFQADEAGVYGLDPTPVAAISTRDQVQGICFTSEEEIVLSTSYGFATSYLNFYEIDTQRVGSMEVMDTEVPLYYLDSENLTKQVSLPPMSEELVCRDGRILVMCESACNKYIFGKFIRGYQVFAYDYTA